MAGIGMNVGLKALLAAQTALDTVGHNIANANTPGYSRKSVLLSGAPGIRVRGLLVGGGVDVAGVVRTVDELLEGRIWTQTSSLAKLTAKLGSLTEVEALLGEPSEHGVSALLDDFFARVSDLSVSPDDGALRAGVVGGMDALAARLREASAGLARVQQDLAPQMSAQVDRLNELAVAVADLNQRIAETEHAGSDANDLRDRRGELVKEMAGLANVSVHADATGAVRVAVAGHVLVGATKAHTARMETAPDGSVEVRVGSGASTARITGGSIGGLLQLQHGLFPQVSAQLDELARQTILELNRVHSTGVPVGGPFTELTGTFPVKDTDADTDVLDERLGDLDLPFDVSAGTLHVNVTNASDGSVTTHRLDVDPQTTTVGGLLDALNAIPGLSAGLTGESRLQIRAQHGFGFDFAPRLDAAPDAAGTFGGARASLGSGAAGPFAIADGATLDLVGAGGPFTVTFQASDFATPGAATATELAAAMNADPGMTAGGLHAVAVDGRLFVQTVGEGAAESFEVAGGSAAAALGWAPGTIVTGSDAPVEVEISGGWTGAGAGRFTFVASGDGTVGETPGLEVTVLDAAGQVVATLAVGENYVPGTELEVADGVRVAFGHGELSASAGDAFAVELVGDSDTADLLVAFGINSLLTGTSAADVAVRADLAADPDLLATSLSGAAGDNGALLRLLDLQSADAAELGGQSLGEFWQGVVSTLGFEVESTSNASEVEAFLVGSLEQQRDQVSGVNLDEEILNLTLFEQAYAAAAQYIQVVNSTSEEILALL